MNGPTPGMARAPIPASNPNVPPMVPPAATPVVVPSGALVCFSCAKSFEPWLSAIRTETSELEKLRADELIHCALGLFDAWIQSEHGGLLVSHVFFSLVLVVRALGRGDADLIGDAAWARNSGRHGLDVFLLFLRPNGPLQGDLTLLSDDLHVVRVRGQRLVVHERATDVLGDFAIGVFSFCWSAVTASFALSR